MARSEASLMSSKSEPLDISVFDSASQRQQVLKTGVLFLAYRTAEDSSHYGHGQNSSGLRTIIDTTTDPAQHFAASHRAHQFPSLTKSCQLEVAQISGAHFYWIGLRNRAYSNNVLKRMHWTDKWHVHLKCLSHELITF